MVLSLAALGVVYGDIGTSPLYALRMCFSSGRLAVSPDNVIGVISLILWSLLILITFKYLTLVLRANNRGEGGILALVALVSRKKKGRKWLPSVVIMGLFGASLLYGDSLITPAISVLSAVEGLKEIKPAVATVNWTSATIPAVNDQAALEQSVLAIPAVKNAKAEVPVLVLLSNGNSRCLQTEKTIDAGWKFTFIKIDVSHLDKISSPGASRESAPMAMVISGGRVAKTVADPPPQGLAKMLGMEVPESVFAQYVVPISLLILLLLFWVQRRGTQAVGTMFGPVMAFWFLIIGVIGVVQMIHAPQIMAALNPWHAVSFFFNNGWLAFITMGAVFLALTGGEALYADMGHFGPRPIRWGWYTLVLPSLMLNYFGQGAWLLRHPEAGVDNLFYRLVPASPWCLYPMIFLATAATVIASQAVISGAFSLTRQAVQLGYCPRVSIIHTSDRTFGQVYLPVVNWLMLAGTVVLVLGFRESDRLASAYGAAVSLDMVVTSCLLLIVMRSLWRWSVPMIVLISIPFILLDICFLGSNLLKVGSGGWVPILIATISITIMTTWHRGRELLNRKLAQQSFPLEDFLDNVKYSNPQRIPGTAVFLSGNPQWIPRTLLHNFKHNKIIHDQVVLLTVRTEDIPTVPEADRFHFEELREGFHRITIRYGFSEDPDLPAVLNRISHPGLNLNPMEVTFFLGRETLILTDDGSMLHWRKDIFSFLSRNARDASKFFHLPPNRVIEVGIQVEL